MSFITYRNDLAQRLVADDHTGSPALNCAALLQGVAFIERLCFDYLDLLATPIGGDLMLTGGGAKSRAWCQLRADIPGRVVKIPENSEAAFAAPRFRAKDQAKKPARRCRARAAARVRK